MATSVSAYITALYEKLQTSEYNPVVSFSESTNLFDDLKTNRYRLEIELDSGDSDDYKSQRDMEWELSLFIEGYIRRAGGNGSSVDNNWTIDDQIAIIEFALDTSRLVHSLLDDKQSGDLVAPGFSRYSGKARFITDFELLPDISTFSLWVKPIFYQSDTALN